MEEYQVLSEEELVLKAQDGDKRALEVLIKNYQGFLNFICERYFLKNGDKDDLLQEATIGLIEAINGFEPNCGKKFKNFAFLCIKREMDSCILRYNRKKHKILNDAIPIFAHAENEEERVGSGSQLSVDRMFRDNGPTPEAQIIEQESIREILFKLNSVLSKMEKEVLHLRINGLSYSEITAKLNLQAKSVDNAVQRIRKKISLDIRTA